MANFRLGYLEHARAALQEAADLQRETGERFWEATSLNSLGWIAYLQADYAAARTFLLDSLDIWQSGANGGGIAVSLNSSAWWRLRKANIDAPRGCSAPPKPLPKVP